MICTITVPQLILAGSKSDNNAFITKTLPRRLDLWIKINFQDLFNEANALQERLQD